MTYPYQEYRLMVRFEDGMMKSFYASPIVAISLEAALADLAEAHGQSCTLVKQYEPEGI